jgi:hypothetical protein
MPKKLINYQKSVIYKIEHLENPALLYVGSTTDFIKRKSRHKTNYNNETNYKLYKMIRENGGWDSFKIMIIKEYPCLNKIELLIEEEKITKQLKASLNTIKAYTTEEEKKEYRYNYIVNNKDKINETRKKYIEKNIDIVKEKQSEYNKLIYKCICGCDIILHNKARHIKSKKHINLIT